MREPVYDILNCGPRHRFWANGKLVHNSNWQNFKRGSDLRRAIMAPEGHLLAAIDLKAIEWVLCRYLAGEHEFVEMYRKGEDPYCPVATQFYGYTVTKDTHPLERQAGKVIELQAQYGSGGEKIRLTLQRNGVHITSDQGLQARDTYRGLHRGTVNYWREGEALLPRIANGEQAEWGPFTVRDRKLFLPNGLRINYDTLEFYREEETGDKYWRLKSRYGWSKMYGAKLVENGVQFAARAVLSQIMIRLIKRGYRIVNTTHDELLILLANDGRQEYHLQECIKEFEVTPEWLPGIPLAAEGSLSERYSK